MNEMSWLVNKLMFFLPLLFSLSIHEFAHAYVAFRLGDDTAARMGRLTINPIAHIDPVGTILLPLMGVPFGWAKPVMINPLRFNRNIDMQYGMMLTAIAGPVSNIGLALAGLLILWLLSAVLAVPLAGAYSLYIFLRILVLMNVILAIFNLLPIPPLDGSRILDYYLPARWRPLWEQYSQYGFLVLLMVIFLPRQFGFSLMDWPIRLIDNLINQIIAGGA